MGRRLERAHRRPRVDRLDVRAAAARFLRQRDSEQRRSEKLQHRSLAADGERRSRVPGKPGIAAARVCAAQAEYQCG